MAATKKTKKNTLLAKLFSKKEYVLVIGFVLGIAVFGTYTAFTSSASVLYKPGYSTHSALSCSFTSAYLAEGSQGACVRTLQRSLNHLKWGGSFSNNMPYLAEDGYFGPTTGASIVSYKEKFKWGDRDPRTSTQLWEHIDQICNYAAYGEKKYGCVIYTK